MGKLFERRGERRLPQHVAGFRRLAVDQEGLREAGNGFQLARHRRREIGEAARHGRAALAGLGGGMAKQHLERQRAALCLGGFERRQHPATYCSWYCQCRERPARRDRLVFAVKLRPRVLAGAAPSHQRADAARRLAEEPEAVAADTVHVRITHRDRRRHRDHRFERIAALGEHGAPCFGGRAMRRADDAAAMSGGVEVHQILLVSGDTSETPINVPSPLAGEGKTRFCHQRRLGEGFSSLESFSKKTPHPDFECADTSELPYSRKGRGHNNNGPRRLRLGLSRRKAALLEQRVRRRQSAAERGVERFRIAPAAGGVDVVVELLRLAGSKMSPVSWNAAKASASSTSDHM